MANWYNAILRWLQSDEPWILASDPAVRLIVFCAIIFVTLLIIGRVYDYQNSRFQIGLRRHANARLARDTLTIPLAAVSGALDLNGIRARITISYVYEDARSRRRQRILVRKQPMTIVITTRSIRRVVDTVYGHEIPDVAASHVVFPLTDRAPPTDINSTPERARDYADQAGLLQDWDADEDANIVTLHADMVDQVQLMREEFIVGHAHKIERTVRSKFAFPGTRLKLARDRPNVMGTYELKLDFPKDPLFLLTRHPDRDLRMTAWLTILTSFFTLLIEVWPKAPPG
jgi:hypothetical protein